MSILQEQAVQMISRLSDDNVSFLIDMMQRFMVPDADTMEAVRTADIADSTGFMQEMENMRLNAKEYFSGDFCDMCN